MIQFYAPDISTTLTLPESDSQHCIRVLRMQCGDFIEVVDGKGLRLKCRITEAHPKRAKVEIVGTTDEKPAWSNHITLAVAPTKQIDRMEWMTEKLVEIGINRIVPLLCRHSERKEIKTDRLEKIAVAAMKQSLKSTLPAISSMTPFPVFVKEMAETNVQKVVGYCDSSTPRRLFAKTYRPNADIVILIGPEGDFSPEEINAAINGGFVPVTFGDNRLRTETAAIVACDTCHILNQAYPE